MLIFQNTRETRNNAVEMSQAFHDIERFEHFMDLNLFVIQTLQFHSMVLIFCQQLW